MSGLNQLNPVSNVRLKYIYRLRSNGICSNNLANNVLIGKKNDQL